MKIPRHPDRALDFQERREIHALLSTWSNPSTRVELLQAMTIDDFTYPVARFLFTILALLVEDLPEDAEAAQQLLSLRCDSLRRILPTANPKNADQIVKAIMRVEDATE